MGDYALDIIFLTPGMPFDGHTDRKASLGGSETMGLMMGRALAARGHRVSQVCNCPKLEMVDGVRYIPLELAQTVLSGRPADVVIGQRAGELFASPRPLASKIRILHHHDLAIIRHTPRLAAGGWNVTDHWVLSDYHRAQFHEVYALPWAKMWKTRNAVDRDLIIQAPRPVGGRQKDLLVYTARPERGMECLLTQVMPRIWAERPEMKLAIAGYDNTVPEMRGFYEGLGQLIAQDERVKHYGPLTKPQLYELYSHATAYIYPTTFEEISCITAMEVQALGLPIIHTGVAALAETVLPGGGIEVPRMGEEEDIPRRSPDAGIRSTRWLDRFARATLDFLAGEHRRAPGPGLPIGGGSGRRDWLMEEGERRRQALDAFGMEALAVDWENRILELFDQVNDNPLRLARWFYFRSEIDGAREVLERTWAGQWGMMEKLVDLDDKIQKDFCFNHAEQYEKIGQDTEHHAYDQVPQEPRFPYTVDWIRDKIAAGELPEDLRILDYGCAYLGWAGHLAKAFPKARIFGVDISAEVLRHGEILIKADQALENKGRLAWHQGDITLAGDGPQPWELAMKRHLGQDPDLTLCLEVLEHVIDPTFLMDRLAGVTKAGGYVFGTTPWGPWEEMSYESYPHRCHLREVEESDLRDIMGHRRGFTAEYMNLSNHNKTMDPLGIFCWWFQEVKTDPPMGRINMDRKLRIQAPRQLVSVCMITKNAEAMLHRTLKSVQGLYPVEIIAVDTGSTDSTKEILERYGARILDGPDPMEAGFATVRNMSTEPALGDWILWIDSDEELTNVPRLHRYFQASLYDALQIRQVHFTVEPPPGTMKPDLPARFFRNLPSFQFYGFVHEHPEKGGMNRGPGFAYIIPDADIAHDGYLTEDVRRARFFRNIQLMLRDREANPGRTLGKFLMIRDWVQGARFDLQQRGPNPQAYDWLMKAVELTEKEMIMAGPHLMDLSQFYSEANALLGRGKRYIGNMTIQGPGENGEVNQPIQIVAPNPEIFWKFIRTMNEGKERQLNSPYY